MSNTIDLKSDHGFLRLPEILEIIPIGKSTWWAWVASGKAPRPIKIGPRITVWKTKAVLDFIKDCHCSECAGEQS